MSTYTDASLIVTPNAKKAGKLYSLKGADLDVVRATTATYVGSDGLIKTALANEVRFDYTNGSCPSILVEPQRTNITLYSNQFNNNYWTKSGGLFVTPNSAISPDGSNNAFIMSGNGSSGFKEMIASTLPSPITSGVTYTYSFYAKANTNNFIQLVLTINSFSGLFAANFDLSNGTLGTVTSGLTATITNAGNGWYKCTGTATSTNTSAINGFILGLVSSASAPRSQTTTLNTSVFIYGAQLEAGPNATSYIPTTTSSVTRNADVISKSGISDLIGQTEGTIYVDVNISKFIQNSTRIFIDVTSTNDANRVYIDMPNTVNGNTIQTAIRANSVFQVVSQAKTISLGKVKVAIAYKSGNCSFYINGESINFTTNNAFSFSSNLDLIRIGIRGNTDISILNDSINNVLLFKTALTNIQLQQLTTL